jgi:hypothetical protein
VVVQLVGHDGVRASGFDAMGSHKLLLAMQSRPVMAEIKQLPQRNDKDCMLGYVIILRQIKLRSIQQKYGDRQLKLFSGILCTGH